MSDRSAGSRPLTFPSADLGSAEYAPDRRVVDTSMALRRSNRQLLAQLRGNLHELRTQQARLGAIPLPPRSAGPTCPPAWLAYGFTEREMDVARLLAEGRRNTAIATALDISPHTARHHTQRVLAKLNVHSRAEAAARLHG